MTWKKDSIQEKKWGVLDMAGEKQLIRLNKREPFKTLLSNPNGARYYQAGRFFNCGGCLLDKDGVLVKDLPTDLQAQAKRSQLGTDDNAVLKQAALNKDEQAQAEITRKEQELNDRESAIAAKEAALNVTPEVTTSGLPETPEGYHQCPHCDHPPYKAERWLVQHIENKHSGD